MLKEVMAGAPQEEPLQPLYSLAMMHFSSCVVPSVGRRAWEETRVLQLLCTKTYTPPVNADFYKP